MSQPLLETKPRTDAYIWTGGDKTAILGKFCVASLPQELVPRLKESACKPGWYAMNAIPVKLHCNVQPIMAGTVHLHCCA